MADDLTLREKTSYAVMRAVEATAEKHYFDAAQPFFPLGFSISWRSPGHWDVYARRCPGKAAAWRDAHPEGFTSERDDDRERAFRIRGEPGAVTIYDGRWDPHRPHPRDALNFRSVTGAMLWIVEELMQEPKAPSSRESET